jgi:murein DD-endopeptidase MepM/ murein hydrolase activator NlpD
VEVPSFSSEPKKTTSADYLDLSRVEKRHTTKQEFHSAKPSEPLAPEPEKSYTQERSDKLKSISPKEKPTIAEQELAEPEEKAELKPEPKEKPKAAEPKEPKEKVESKAEIKKEEKEEEHIKMPPPKPAATAPKPEPVKEAKKPEPKPEPKVEVKEAETLETPKTADIASIPKIEKPNSSAKFVKPVEGKIIQEFGTGNDGITIQAAEGTAVKAASGGEVVYSGNQLQGYGNMIVIKHPGGYLTAYSHLEDLNIKKGAKVSQGDVIGSVGKTGNVTTPQLHFGVRKGRNAVNPRDFLN